MTIKENIKNFKSSVRNSTFLKVIITLSALIYPALWILPYYNIFSDILDLNFLNPIPLLWVGFYSSIALIYFVGVSFINVLIVIANIFFILVTMFVSMMGGVLAPVGLTIKMILPFIPLTWIDILISSLFY